MDATHQAMIYADHVTLNAVSKLSARDAEVDAPDRQPNPPGSSSGRQRTLASAARRGTQRPALAPEGAAVPDQRGAPAARSSTSQTLAVPNPWVGEQGPARPVASDHELGERPTLRWLFQCFEGIDLHHTPHADGTRSTEVLRLTTVHRLVLHLLGSAYENCYLTSQETAE